MQRSGRGEVPSLPSAPMSAHLARWSGVRVAAIPPTFPSFRPPPLDALGSCCYTVGVDSWALSPLSLLLHLAFASPWPRRRPSLPHLRSSSICSAKLHHILDDRTIVPSEFPIEFPTAAKGARGPLSGQRSIV